MKKLALLILALGLVTTTAQAEPYYFGSMKAVVPAGSEGGWGVGGSFDVGIPLGEQIILRGTYEGQKTEDGTGYDNVYTGFTVMSNVLIPKVRTGVYLTGQGGLSKVPGMAIEGATLSSIGFYSAIGLKTKVWLGGGYSTVADEGQIWSITLALSIQAPLE